MAQLEIALKLIKIRTIRDGIFVSKLSEEESNFPATFPISDI